MENKNCNAHLYADILKSTQFTVPQLHLPYSNNFELLAKKKAIGAKTANNRICYQPMEGQDADADGSPTQLTFDRYSALSRGGAGIIWIEAVSVLPDARSNPHQLMITKQNVDEYKKLIFSCKEICIKENGFEPIIVLQLNHSGRYSKPDGTPRPITAFKNTDFEKPVVTYEIATDEYLSAMPDIFAQNALLCESAGVDIIDIKCCHGYLYSELLSATDRQGKYGGSFENRTRLLLDTFKASQGAVSHNTQLSCRLNIYDGYKSKYSFGTDKNNHEKYDLKEPIQLISKLCDCGLTLLNATMGSPYVNPDVSRPYKSGIDHPKTNALEALHRLFFGVAEIHRYFPDLPIVNTGVSGLCSGAPYGAAGMIEEDMTDFVGFGRMNFAYPDLARDIISGDFDSKRSCVACSGCSTLKKNGKLSGCIIRNNLYKNIFKELNK